ncbi:hypothetical protein DID78_03920 [Candidatus Marinamargulisbacteria bacterium SCGC AG-343-D04]|nr:hypothetical protein DID78_03920 [Candidatus Marinamargulisbacteria bacterium SCGC AG-343-D04]
MKTEVLAGSETTLFESRRGELWALRVPGPSADCWSALGASVFLLPFFALQKKQAGVVRGWQPP